MVDREPDRQTDYVRGRERLKRQRDCDLRKVMEGYRCTPKKEFHSHASGTGMVQLHYTSVQSILEPPTHCLLLLGLRLQTFLLIDCWSLNPRCVLPPPPCERPLGGGCFECAVGSVLTLTFSLNMAYCPQRV